MRIVNRSKGGRRQIRSKYPAELRERAARMVAEVRPDRDGEYAAIANVAKLLGVGSPKTIRQWIRYQDSEFESISRQILAAP